MADAHRAEKALFVGDHVVLDLLNTLMRVNDRSVDALENDQSVLDWLARAGLPRPALAPRAFAPGAIVQAARELRETVRAAIVQRKAGKAVQVRALNAWLARSMSHLSLGARKDGTVRLARKWQADTAEQLLIPLAEAAADLLVNGNFELIRQCESEACVLWFYDRTKSHHRRWCSVARCGNRSKVAAFRKRRAESAAQ